MQFPLHKYRVVGNYEYRFRCPCVGHCAESYCECDCDGTCDGECDCSEEADEWGTCDEVVLLALPADADCSNANLPGPPRLVEGIADQAPIVYDLILEAALAQVRETYDDAEWDEWNDVVEVTDLGLETVEEALHRIRASYIPALWPWAADIRAVPARALGIGDVLYWGNY